jgi:hypothetical protein
MNNRNKIWLAMTTALIVYLVFAWPAASVYYDKTCMNLLVKGRAYVTGTLTVIGDAVLPTGSIGAGEIEDRVHRIPVPLASVFVDGTGPITSSSAPNLTTVDNAGAIVYDDHSEHAEIQFDWYPDTYFTGMEVHLWCSSSGADGTEHAVDWSVLVHDDGVAFPTAIAQTGASLTSSALDEHEEEVTLTLNATAIAAITGGSSAVDVAVWNDGTSDNTFEIKKIAIHETR